MFQRRRAAERMHRGARRATLGGEMTRVDWTTLRARSLAALLTVVIVGFCLAASTHDAGAAAGCPTPDGALRFCAQSSMADHAPVVIAPVIPVAAEPEPGVWVPAAASGWPDAQRHLLTPAPRAPPSLGR